MKYLKELALSEIKALAGLTSAKFRRECIQNATALLVLPGKVGLSCMKDR